MIWEGITGSPISWQSSLKSSRSSARSILALLVPRSSTFKNFGIIQTNHCGIIDESYCGDGDQWFFPAYALRDTRIHVNDRICQFRIVEHQPAVTFETVERLADQDRGGLGSTGVR